MEENENPKENNPSFATIHTFEGDAAHAVKTGEITVAKIVSSQTASQQHTESPRTLSLPGKIFAILFALLLIIGGSAIGIYTYKNRTKPVAVVTPLATPILAADTTVPVDMSGNRAEPFIAAIQNAQQSESTLTYILTSQVLTTEEGTTTVALGAESLLNILTPEIPEGLLRSFNSEIMPGVYAPSLSTFFIIPIRDYNSAFAGMLSWEDTLPREFEKYMVEGSLSDGGFRDATIESKDVRVYESDLGGEQIVYGFFDKKYLIIAENNEAYNSLFSRLAALRTNP